MGKIIKIEFVAHLPRQVTGSVAAEVNRSKWINFALLELLFRSIM